MNDLHTELIEDQIQKPITDEYISIDTPLGAHLMAEGATFRAWAPAASTVYLRIADRADVINETGDTWQPTDKWKLHALGDGTWAGFVRGVRDGDYYRFYIGSRTQPYKRDPYARELEMHGWPDVDCIVRDPNSYPWHDAGFRTPAFNDLALYQFHVGRYFAVDENGHDVRDRRVGKFLDLVDRIPYWADLGINAIAPLPIVEFDGPHSLGYNGKDLYSPEMDYAVEPSQLGPYLNRINALLSQCGQPPLRADQIEGQHNQLKVLIDLCHLHGIAVILDVVYNHAGHFGDDDQSIYFFDRDFTGNNADSLYFMNADHAGGLVFDFHKPQVRDFLINNAAFFLGEYHVDGLRHDQVTVIDEHGGWPFLQELTGRVRAQKPQAIHIAEYWRSDKTWAMKNTHEGGAGFDAVWSETLRESVRFAIAQASIGRDARLNLDAVAAHLPAPAGFVGAWRSVHHLENHDRQWLNHDDRNPRIAALGDPGDHRSWYARSRARVANGLLLTAPGIPMLFMGQEFLEDKFWTDAENSSALIWWDGLIHDRHMRDHLRFTRDLLGLRCRHPALRGEGINVFHVHNDNRVIAFHRWVQGSGRDVVVIASLNESPFHGYALGFPCDGHWFEAFNSDVYDHWVNPQVQGNGGHIHATGASVHGLPYSASITIPANSVLVFTRDVGD